MPRDEERRPVAVEVELSVKSPRRLEAICRAWARCRLVESVRYYAAPLAAHAVGRAVDRVGRAGRDRDPFVGREVGGK
jgi:hypothetical protein